MHRVLVYKNDLQTAMKDIYHNESPNMYTETNIE